MKIAGTVILYNPEREVISNIKTYLPFLDKLYVMDNSTKEYDFVDEIKLLEKIEVISMNGNQGIAKALKVAIDKSIEEGFEFILTMDQDSKYPTEDFGIIKNYLETANLSNVGIVAINFSGGDVKTSENGKFEFLEVKSIIQSGSIYVLENYKKIRGINPDLFIDYVDFDICAQFLEIGYKIILFRNIVLNHELGIVEPRRFLFLKMTKSWHSPLRSYYMYRNKYFLRRNKSFRKNVKIHPFLINLIYTVGFSKEKFKTFKMIMQGVYDAKHGILGKYEDRKQTKNRRKK